MSLRYCLPQGLWIIHFRVNREIAFEVRCPHESTQANRINPFKRGLYGLEGRAARSAGCTFL